MHRAGTPAVNLQDLTGRTFGKLTALHRGPSQQFPSGVMARWICRCECGRQSLVLGSNLKSANTTSCGCVQTANRRRAGQQSPKWKGGRFLNHDGYALLFVAGTGDDTYRRRRGSYEYEHVVMMSRKLGRKLLSNETVHHLNGIRDDNRDANLELWSHSHPCGQRVADKVEWAKQIIQTYEPEWRIN